MTPDQIRVHRHIVDTRGGIGGPYDALLRLPDLAERLLAVGDTIRFASALDDRRMELAIVLTARHWGAAFAWYAHTRLATKAGLPRGVLEAVAARQRPVDGADPLDLAVHDFVVELLETANVLDPTYAAVEQVVGKAGAVSLTATVGYYCLVAAVLNADGVPAPPSDPPLPEV